MKTRKTRSEKVTSWRGERFFGDRTSVAKKSQKNIKDKINKIGQKILKKNKYYLKKKITIHHKGHEELEGKKDNFN